MLLVLLVLLLVIAGLLAWVAGTRSGLAFAWSEIGPRLPQGIAVASVQGRLIGPLKVRGVKIDTSTMNVSINAIDLDWTARDLLAATVHITNLAVRGVDYQAKQAAQPRSNPSKPFSLPAAIHLPVTVQIDRVAVDGVSASTAPGAKPVVVNSARLADARLGNTAWTIKSLTGSGPLFDIKAHARVQPGSGYTTRLGVEATLRLPNLAPVNAHATMTGAVDDLKLQASVAAPYNVSLTGQVKNALAKPTLDADLKLANTRIQAIRASLPQVGVNADLTAKGPIDDLALTLDTHADSAAYGKAVLSTALHYSPNAIRIDRLKLSSPDLKGMLKAEGRVALAKGYAMNLSLDWSDLKWPLTGKAAYLSPKGEVRLTGPVNDYKLDTDLTWQVVGQAQGKLDLAGSGSTQAFDLSRLKITGGPGDISGHAKIAWAPAIEGSAHIEGHDINPGAVVTGLPGKFDLKLDATAARKNGQLHADVQSLTAEGTLRHQPLHLNAKASYAGNHVVVDTFKLVSGATTARIGGRFGWTPDARLDGHWSLDSSDLSTLWPTLSGALKSHGKVTGVVKAPNIQATMKADHLAVSGNRVAHAMLDAHVDWSGATQSKVALSVDGVDAGGQTIKKVAVDANGTPASHRISARLSSDIADADVALDGHLEKNNHWRFTLDRLRASYRKLAPWSLAVPASGRVSAQSQSIDNACLVSGSARLCIKGAHDAKASTAQIKLSDLAYAYAQSFFPSGLDVGGAVSGTVDARVPAAGAPDIKADLQTTGGQVTMKTADAGKVRILDMKPGHIALTMAPDGLKTNVDLPLANSGGIKAQLAVQAGGVPLTQRPLSGTVRVNIAKLDFIQRLSPQVAHFEGHIQGDLNINGTLAQPRVLGNLAVDAPRIVLISPGLTLTGVHLVAAGHGNSIGIKAKAESGGGSLHVDGGVALNSHGQDVHLAIKGDHFQIVNIPDVTAYASPDLEVKVSPSRVDVTGSVTVPKASITPRNLPAAGVETVSSDQVIVSGKKKPVPKAVSRAVHANVKVILGKKIHINGFGLKADLNGALRVIQQPGNQTTGTGQINIVNGSYRAYGQNLNIQTGRILFAGGPVSEPGVDIKAVRKPNDNVTVGVQVRGTLKDPKLTLFSSPSMSQSEQLSWLLLGRPLQGATGQQSSLVARAALALGSSRANRVFQGIGNKLGLDQVGIGTEADSGAGKSAGAGSESAAFTVGKYLTPKLYVSYGIGLFDSVSTLSLRYTLNSHWRLETQSSSVATGGDIVYSISP